MFRRKHLAPAADIDKYLSELRAYAKAHYMPKPKAGIKYSLPPMGKEHISDPGSAINYSFPEDESDYTNSPGGSSLYDVPALGEMPFSSKELMRTLGKLDSPAMKRYYHAWEKQKSVTKTFSSEVMRLVNAKFTKASAFYLPAGIDKRTFHKIRKDYLYKPSRSTAMKCCLGLKLDMKASEELLRLAGYSFSPSDPSDLVVMFCIEKGIWDIASVNYLMDSFDLKDLDGYSPE